MERLVWYPRRTSEGVKCGAAAVLKQREERHGDKPTLRRSGTHALGDTAMGLMSVEDDPRSFHDR
jgi:hypothetical protein